MQVNFATSGQPTVSFELGAPAPRLLDAAAAVRPPLRKERRAGEYVWTRNGIVVPYPETVRWVYFRFSDDRPDLEGEVSRPTTFRMCADASVRRWGGWIDLNHWSRAGRFPKSLADAGRSPVEFVVGKLTEIRVDDADTSWAEGYLWPASAHMPPERLTKMHEHADTAWGWLEHAPDMVHCSAGGPLVKHEPEWRDGRWVTPIDIYLNHLAICLQGVHTDTEVRRRPWGAFADAAEVGKAVAGGVGVRAMPECPGGGFECYVRGLPPTPPRTYETAKAVTAASVAASVPEDLEGVARKAPIDFADGPTDCGHMVGGKFATDHDAREHLTDCLHWPASRASRYITAARAAATP